MTPTLTLTLTPALALAPTPALTPTLTLTRYVDNLFEFSQSLGYDYSGAWLDDSTFRVEVLRGPPVALPLHHRCITVTLPSHYRYITVALPDSRARGTQVVFSHGRSPMGLSLVGAGMADL